MAQACFKRSDTAVTDPALCRDQQRLAVALTIEVLGLPARIGSGGEEIEGVVVDDRFVSLVDASTGTVGFGEQLLDPVDQQGPMIMSALPRSPACKGPRSTCPGYRSSSGVNWLLIFPYKTSACRCGWRRPGLPGCRRGSRMTAICCTEVGSDSQIPKAGRHVALGRVVKNSASSRQLAGQLKPAGRQTSFTSAADATSRWSPPGGRSLFETPAGGGVML